MRRVGTGRSLAAVAKGWQRTDSCLAWTRARTSYHTLAAAPHASPHRPPQTRSLPRAHGSLWPHAGTRALLTSAPLRAKPDERITFGPRDVTVNKGSTLRVKVTRALRPRAAFGRSPSAGLPWS
jgi:hypothetical protein